MLKRMLSVVAVLVVLIGAVLGHTIYKISKMKKHFAEMKPPLPVVSVSQVEAETWQPKLTAVGTLQAVNGVNVSSEVPGTVKDIYFKSGQLVKKGQSLVRLDDSIDKQNLKSMQAQLQLKKIGYEQQTQLFAEHATSKIALDQAKAALASALVAVENAKTNLSNKLIKAPFAGTIGIRKVNLGEFVNAGQPMVSLQSMNPLYVQFYLPEQNLSELKINQNVTATVDGYNGHIFTGKLTAINAEVDPQTRNIEVQATVPNDKHLLYPGVFANITVQLPVHQKVMVVPETAITYSLYGDSVFVAKPQRDKGQFKVKEKFVTVGLRQGKEVSILKGLTVGDQVVTSGQQKLHDGDAIKINNKVQV